MAQAHSDSSFIQSLSEAPHSFLTPDLPLHTDILKYVKHLLDPIAAEVFAAQHDRLRDERRKRKRSEHVDESGVLRLKQVHIDGMATGQVWEQARQIIEATTSEARRSLEEINAAPKETSDASSDIEDELVDANDIDSQSSDSHDEDLDSDGDITKEALEDGDVEMDSDGLAIEDQLEHESQAEEYVPDKFGLNDGFFSIDDFNRQSEFLEQQDTRGENDGAASDEEDVDWDLDPLSAANGAGTALTNGVHSEGEEEEDDENGPTFGDPDAPSEDEDEDVDGGDMDGIVGLGNTNDILYADFFAPPAQKKSKNKKKKQQSRAATAKTDAQDDDVQRTMAAVHRDLFEDDEDDDDDGEAEDAEQLDHSDPRSRKSAHERRQAALAEEIRKLEQANVAKREWTMSGEARAADRPMNSLLEEDLDFERTGKPVPVITVEVSESIEELIKRRIIAHEFQDIVRRRPDDLAASKDSRRGRLDFNLDDTKSKKGLAEEYEEEHLRTTDPNFVDVKDEKLAKEQREIEAMWKDVCAKLDSLSSWHFRPKQATAQLDIRVDAPTISMEDARPNAGGEVSAASQLAPQEIYKAGEGSKGVNEEVVGKSGLPARREELTSDEKKRRRRRDKERIRKSSSNNDKTRHESKASKEKQQILGDLKKGNVKVIGKKGELTDVSGNAIATSNSASHTAAKFKL